MKTSTKSPRKEIQLEKKEVKTEVQEEKPKEAKPVHDFFGTFLPDCIGASIQSASQYIDVLITVAPRKPAEKKEKEPTKVVKKEEDDDDFIAEEDAVVVESRPKVAAKSSGTTKYTSGAYDPVADAGWKSGDKYVE
jgi:hypothetical protein